VVQGDRDTLSSVHALLDRFLPARAESGGPLDPAAQILARVTESRGQFSALGVPLFVWLSTRFYRGVRVGLNHAFETRESRSWWVSKAVDFALVVVSLLVLVAGTAVGLLLPDGTWLERWFGRTVSFGFGAVLFYLIYTIAPSRRVPRDTAVVAAAVAALGFEVARVLYGVYLAEFATVDRLVSNANAIAGGLFLVWMYYTAVVFLIGGEVAQTYELWRRPRAETGRREAA